MKYRPDIDGLRALAVVPVVLFHAGFETIGGGFIGVDVFFVISGFLITSIIYNEMLADKFSFLAFYERRARRILPALCVVLGFSLLAGWFILLPAAYHSMANSALATTVFASNVYFKKQTGYFAEDADMFPLLHTWSLAVEEQFYIGFPPLLLLLVMWARKFLGTAMLVLTAGSLALSIWALRSTPEATFFLIPMRAWELAIGALLAIGIVPAAWSRHRTVREGVALAGLILIVAPILFYTKGTPFPGLAALPPCLGAAAIIWAGMAPLNAPKDDAMPAVSRLLSSRGGVFIGLISYSLYLWHWPLLVFARHLTVSPVLDRTVAIFAVMLSLVAAALSWRYVEQPFRDRSIFNRGQVFKAGVAASAALAVFGAVIALRNGVPGRYNSSILSVATTVPYSRKGANCLNKPLQNGEIRADCRFGPADKVQARAPVEFLLWGDSHSAAVVPVFESIAERTGMVGAISAFTACPALSDNVSRMFSAKNRRDCWTHNRNTLDYVLKSQTIKFVVLCGYWKKYFREHEMYDLSGTSEAKIAGVESRRLILAGLEKTIEQIAASGKRVVVLDRLPEPGFLVPWTLAMSMQVGKALPALSRPHASEFGDDMGSVFSKYSVVEIAMDEPICSGSTCKFTDNLTPIFGDEHHLTEYGAKTYFAPYVFQKLFGASGVLGAK